MIKCLIFKSQSLILLINITYVIGGCSKFPFKLVICGYIPSNSSFLNKPIGHNQLTVTGICPNKPFWEASSKSGGSWFWKGFLEAANFIEENAWWTIGNGEHISMWNNNWIPCKQGLRKPYLIVNEPALYIMNLWNINKDWDVDQFRYWPNGCWWYPQK